MIKILRVKQGWSNCQWGMIGLSFLCVSASFFSPDAVSDVIWVAQQRMQRLWLSLYRSRSDHAAFFKFGLC